MPDTGLVLDEFKERQRATWSAGDYASLSPHIRGMGERVVARAGVEPGMSVLDVACGDGNAAFPAARAGGRVTGLDIAPALLDAGRARAEAEGLDIEWIEGDAEALPYGDDTFDRVFSTVGHMFAPRHRRTADEMARVCRSGGLVAICCWTPEGTVGDVFRASGAFMPPPPDYASPPILWGTEDHVRDMFGAVATGFEFERHYATVEWESPESFNDEFADRFPPLVTARAMLGERFEALHGQLLEIWKARNEADDGTLRLPQEYLQSIVRLA